MEESLINAISTLGYPIVCSIGLAFAIWKMYLKMFSTLDVVTETNKELVITNSSLIKNIDNKVDKLEVKVDKLIER
ncbi:iduronate sulfatase [Clostridium sp.]|uniref:iduronate sulfatase n=1 Tax=Clostridium sp. TaxID=1506 RepID=UPI0032178F4B